ncbi:MAG: MFS transporter [Enterococcus sp.]
MNKNYNPSSVLFKASILAISIDATASGVVSGAIPVMQESFSHAPSYLVESISTLPSLSILLFVLLSSLVTKRIGYKKTVLLGMMISFLSGIAPFFLDNIYLILVMRFLFGAGIGLLNPLSYSIISYFYSGNERAQMFGLISTVSNFASVILTALAGLLLQYTWRASFLTYFVLLAVFFLVLFFVPDVKINEESTEKTSFFSELKTINKTVLLYGVCMFVLFSVFMTVNIKLGSLVVENGYGTATQASFLLSLSNLTGIIIGVIFGFVYKNLGHKLFPISLAVMSSAYFLIAQSTSLVMTGGIIVLLASAFSFLSTFIFLRVSQLAPKEMNNVVSSMMLVAINLGAFLCPYTMSLIAKISGSSTPNASLTACGFIVLGLFATVVLGKLFLKNKINTASFDELTDETSVK